MKHLARDDLAQKLDEIEFFPELEEYLDEYLKQYIHALDEHLVARLLEAGAGPDAQDDLDDYMLYLLHEYEVNKSLKGELILSTTELLLQHGANPNRVVMNNLRAYDYAARRRITEVAQLLEKYGADKQLREVI